MAKKVQREVQFGRKQTLSWHFDDFKIGKRCVFDAESYQRPHLVPALQSCGSGIDVQKPEPFIVLHFQYMAVTADEEFRRSLINLSGNLRGIAPGVASDVRH